MAQNTIPKLVKIKAKDGDIGNKRGTVRLGKQITAQMIEKQNYEEWTTDELRRGRRANPPGSSHFQGPDPKLVTKECAREFTKRIFTEAEAALRDGIPKAIEMLNAIIEGADTKDADRLKAIEMLLNRTMGREALNVNVAVDSPWLKVMAESIVAVPIEQQTGVIDVPSTEV